MDIILLNLFVSRLSFPPRGFASALCDFSAFVVFAFLADNSYGPKAPYGYRWLFFALCVILAVLYFCAWIVDLGAHI
jgi:hypothetical protein